MLRLASGRSFQSVRLRTAERSRTVKCVACSSGVQAVPLRTETAHVEAIVDASERAVPFVLLCSVPVAGGNRVLPGFEFTKKPRGTKPR